MLKRWTCPQWTTGFLNFEKILITADAIRFLVPNFHQISKNLAPFFIKNDEKVCFFLKKNPYHLKCISIPLKSYSSCLWHKNKSIDYHLTKYTQFLVKNYCKNMRKNHQNSAVSGIKKIILISRFRQALIAKLYCIQN